MGEGTRRSPSTLRAEVAAALRLKLARDGCFQQVLEPGAPSTGVEPVVLRVLVDDYREETRWDIGLVERTQPTGGHDPELDVKVVLDVTAQAELHVAANRPPVRQKTFAVHVSKTPQAPGQDAAGEGRAVLVEKIVKETHKLLCKGSRSKLARDIARERSPQR